MPAKFELISFPSLVVMTKGDKIEKELLSDGEYKLLEDFVKLLDSEEPVDPLSILNVTYDERGSIDKIYGPVIGRNEESTGLVISCNGVKYSLDFKVNEGLFFKNTKVMPLLSGKEYEKTNKDKKKVKIQPCSGLIGIYQLVILIDELNPFAQNDQILFMSGFMSGDKACFDAFLKFIREPSTGGFRIKPNEIPEGLYIIKFYEESDDKFGKAIYLDLESLLDKSEVLTYSCEYFKNKFLTFNASSLKNNTKLYLIVDKPKEDLNGKKSFNGSFSFKPEAYFAKMTGATV